MSPVQKMSSTYYDSGTVLSISHVFYLLILITILENTTINFFIYEAPSQIRNLLQVTQPESNRARSQTQVCDTPGATVSDSKQHISISIHKPWCKRSISFLTFSKTLPPGVMSCLEVSFSAKKAMLGEGFRVDLYF